MQQVYLALVLSLVLLLRAFLGQYFRCLWPQVCLLNRYWSHFAALSLALFGWSAVCVPRSYPGPSSLPCFVWDYKYTLLLSPWLPAVFKPSGNMPWWVRSLPVLWSPLVPGLLYLVELLFSCCSHENKMKLQGCQFYSFFFPLWAHSPNNLGCLFI